MPDPAQPKIKLKIGQQAETPSSSKKITLHVGGRNGDGESPAPPSAADSPVPKQETNGVATPGQMAFAPIDKTRSGSAASPSPSVQPPAVKADVGSPAVIARPGTANSSNLAAAVNKPVVATPAQPPPPPPPQAAPVEPRQLRPAGKGNSRAHIILNMHLLVPRNGRCPHLKRPDPIICSYAYGAAISFHGFAGCQGHTYINND